MTKRLINPQKKKTNLELLYAINAKKFGINRVRIIEAEPYSATYLFKIQIVDPEDRINEYGIQVSRLLLHQLRDVYEEYDLFSPADFVGLELEIATNKLLKLDLPAWEIRIPDAWKSKYERRTKLAEKLWQFKD